MNLNKFVLAAFCCISVEFFGAPALAETRPCVVSGQLAPNTTMFYQLRSNGFAHLVMGMEVSDVTYTGIQNRADGMPFVEFDFPIKSDGTFFDQRYSVVLHIGDTYSMTTDNWIDEYVSTVTFGQESDTKNDLDVRGSLIKYPAMPNNLGLLGPVSTSLESFLSAFKSGASLSVAAHNKDDPTEKVSANIDMAKALSAFQRIENIDQTMRARASSGGCLPVD